MLFTVFGASAELEWINPPESDEYYNDDFELNVSSSSDVTFYWRPVNENNFSDSKEVTQEDFTQDDGNFIYTHGFSETSDEYFILVNNTEDDEQSVDSITLDKANPSVDEVSPSSYTQDSPTVEVDASDSLSGIDKVLLNVTDENGDEVDSTVGQQLDLNDLADGEYAVDYSAYDRAGNVRSDDYTFNVDTSYDGPTSIDVDQSPGDYRVTGDTFVIPLMVNGSDTDESDIRIRCDMGGYSLESGWRDPTSSQYFECAPDTSDYQDLTLGLDVVLEDRAGNTYTETVGDYTFDRTSPELRDVSIPAEVQNDDFEVSYSASDTGSGVENIHYQIDNSEFDMAQGFNVSHEGESFTVDVDDIDTGTHTLYVWSIDGVGRTSTVQSLDFEYDPGAKPEVDVGTDPVEVTAGERATLSVNVTNTGEVFIDTLTLGVSGNLFNRSRDVDSMKPSDSTSEAFTFQTEDNDLGVNPVSITADPGDGEAETDITVRANEQQRNDLDSRLEDWVDTRVNLGSNVTDLVPKLNEDRRSRLESNFTDFNETVERAISAREEERYWKVSDVLGGIEDEYDSAKRSFDQVKKEYTISRNQRNIAFVLLMVVSFGGFGIGYAFYREDVEIQLEAVESAIAGAEVSGISAVAAPFSAAYESLLEMLEEEEEEMESGFQGFT